jgi:membrane protease YdiL (CAAX protease family)
MYYALFLVGLSILTVFIGYSTVATARLFKHWRAPYNPLLNRADMVLRLVLIGLCIGLGLLSQLDWVTLGWVVEQPLRQVLIGLGVGGALAIGLFALSTRLVRTTETRFYSQEFVKMITPRSTKEFYQVMLALGPVVLLEELLFRSLLLGGLSPIIDTTLLLIGVSVIFGAMHLLQGIWGMVGAGLASIVFGALFLTEQSLLAPVVAHYVANLLQIILAMRLLLRQQQNVAERSGNG